MNVEFCNSNAFKIDSPDLKEKVMLECVGSIGFGENALQSSISQQTKFFRKFGFRVSKDRKDKYGNLTYVQMMYDEDKFDPSIVMNELKDKSSK